MSSDEETDYTPNEAFIEVSAQPEPLRHHVSIVIPYTEEFWRGKFLVNHTGKSYWRGKFWQLS